VLVRHCEGYGCFGGGDGMGVEGDGDALKVNS